MPHFIYLICHISCPDIPKMKEKLKIEWESYFEDCDNNLDKVCEKFMKKYKETDKECIPRKTTKTGRKNSVTFSITKP